MKNYWLIQGMIVAGLLVGCDQSDEQSNNVPQSMPNIIPPQHATIHHTKKGVPEECPRLVQKRVDSTTVSRQDSLKGGVCDYFIYPKIGEIVSVSVSDDRLSTSLHLPHVHDFANGAYQVKNHGRHVIRLQFDAFGYPPNVMDYVILVDIQKKS